MKIIQILISPDKSLIGLGDDGKLYIFGVDAKGKPTWVDYELA